MTLARAVVSSLCSRSRSESAGTSRWTQGLASAARKLFLLALIDLHCLVPDGVFVEPRGAPLAFHPLPPQEPHILRPLPTEPPRERVPWAALLRRSFAIDVFPCPICPGRMRVVADLDEPTVTAKILEHLGLPSHARPIAPARERPQLELDGERDRGPERVPTHRPEPQPAGPRAARSPKNQRTRPFNDRSGAAGGPPAPAAPACAPARLRGLNVR